MGIFWFLILLSQPNRKKNEIVNGSSIPYPNYLISEIAEPMCPALAMTFQIYGQHCTFESHAKFEFMNLKRRHRLCTFMYRLVKVIAQSIIMTSKSFYSNCSLPLIIKILINRLVIINRGCLTHAPHVSTFKSIAFPQFSHPNSV